MENPTLVSDNIRPWKDQQLYDDFQNMMQQRSSKLDENMNEFTTLMEKEIFEQPTSIRQSMMGRVDFEKARISLKGIEKFIHDIIRSRRIVLCGAASSYHVAIACRQIMEELLDMPIFVELASDLLDREVPIFRDDVCIFISQSGETASVVSACRYCKQHEALVMGITNGENSRLNGETDFGININAGNEEGVTSTKTYTSQFVVLVMFALQLASDKKSKRERCIEIINEMHKLPQNINTVLQLNDLLRTIARKYIYCNSLLVMGRGFQQATSIEGSFKFTEIAKIHSEGINSGELKHGPLALIDENMPIIMIILRDAIHSKCMNAVEQVRARGGKPIIICEEGDEETKKMADHAVCIPKTSDCLMGILAVIPFQLLALHLAKYKEQNIDSPKHLRKVVVEE